MIPKSNFLPSFKTRRLREAESVYEKAQHLLNLPENVPSHKKKYLDCLKITDAKCISNPQLQGLSYPIQNMTQHPNHKKINLLLELADRLRIANILQNILIRNRLNIFALKSLREEFPNQGVWNWNIIEYISTHLNRIHLSKKITPFFKKYQMWRFFGKKIKVDGYWVIQHLCKLLIQFTRLLKQTVSRCLSLLDVKNIMQIGLHAEQRCSYNDDKEYGYEQLCHYLKNHELKPSIQHIKYIRLVCYYAGWKPNKVDFESCLLNCHTLTYFRNLLLTNFNNMVYRSSQQLLGSQQQSTAYRQFTKRSIGICHNFSQFYIDNIKRIIKACEDSSILKNCRIVVLDQKPHLLQDAEGQIVTPQQIFLKILRAVEKLVQSNIYMSSLTDPYWGLQKPILASYPQDLLNYIEEYQPDVMQNVKKTRRNEPFDRKTLPKYVKNLVAMFTNASVSTYVKPHKWKEFKDKGPNVPRHLHYELNTRDSLFRNIHWLSIDYQQKLRSILLQTVQKDFNKEDQKVPARVSYLSKSLGLFLVYNYPSPLRLTIEQLYTYCCRKATTNTPYIQQLKPFAPLFQLMEQIKRLKEVPFNLIVFKTKQIVEHEDQKDSVSSFLKLQQDQLSQDMEFESDSESESYLSKDWSKSEISSIWGTSQECISTFSELSIIKDFDELQRNLT